MRPLGTDDPARIGDYRLLGLLGSGGMGRVYLGRSAGGRTVAVKVIRPDLIGAEFRERFRREVTAARRVGSKFTAPVLDADVDADPPWLATGYVAGFSLTEAVEQFGTCTENTLLVLAHGLAEALIAVHGAGVVHRDLKPSNVLLAVDGPKVIDFGIARAAEDSALTTTGNVVGSPGFMCPEQIVGPSMGPAGDVFALGGVLVYAATGQGPFGAGETVQMLYRVVYEEPRLDAVPERLRPLIAACLIKDVERRPTPQQLLDLLTELGVPERGGWLPAPVLEEVSRRAVALLDLESGPMPGDGQGVDSSRYAQTMSRPAAGTADPYRPHDEASGSGAIGEHTPQPNTMSRPMPSPSGNNATQSAGSHSAQPGGGHYAPRNDQSVKHASPTAYAPYPPATHQPGPYLAQPYGGQPPATGRGGNQPAGRARRRAALIVGAVVASVVVAVGAFIVGTQLTGGDSPSSTTARDIGGTGVSDPPTSAGRSTVQTAAAGTPVPKAFVGTWTGTAKDALATFDIELIVRDGKVGEEIATSSNTGTVSGGRCERAERLTDVTDTEITFTARLSGGSGGCMDDGSTSTVTLRSDGSATYSMTGLIGDIKGTLRKS